MGKLPISVCIITHNNGELATRCIDAVLYGSAVEEIIMLDNGSDVLFEYVAEGVRVVRSEENIGCVAGRNLLAAQTKEKWILFLDDDQFVSSDTISKLYAMAEIKQLDIVGSCLQKADSNGIGFPIEQIEDSPRVYLGGGGLFIKREVFECLDGLDEVFAPAYCSDADFHWRAVLAGYSWGWLEGHGIEHIGSATMHTQKTWDHGQVYQRSHSVLRKRWGDRLNAETMPLTAILMITHNRHDVFKLCFENALKKSNSDICLLDNGSDDIEAREYYDAISDQRVTKYRSDKNLFCAPGRAFLIEKMISNKQFGKYKYILFLDDDVLVDDESFDSTLSGCMEADSGAVQGILKNKAGNIIESGSKIEIDNGILKRHARIDGTGICRSDFCIGGFSLVRKSIIENTYKYMYFYPSGYADYDMIFRIKAMGYRCAVNHNVSGIHINQWGRTVADRESWRTVANRLVSLTRFRAMWGLTDTYVIRKKDSFNSILENNYNMNFGDLLNIGFKNGPEMEYENEA